MLARNPLASVPPIGFDRPVILPVVASLANRLDTALLALPVVRTFGPADPAVEALERPLGLGDAGLVTRAVRLVDHRRLAVVAFPSSVWSDPAGRSATLALKRAAAAIGRRVLLAPEQVLTREPFASNTLMVAGCYSLPVAPADQVTLMAALLENGGELPLADAVELMTHADDPVAAVLALAARRVVALDLTQALGPDTRVLEAPRRRICS